MKCKILGKIYREGNEDSIWRICTNQELMSLYDRDIVSFDKCEQVGWLWHLARMKEGGVPRRMVYLRQGCGRRKGRHGLRW